MLFCVRTIERDVKYIMLSENSLWLRFLNFTSHEQKVQPVGGGMGMGDKTFFWDQGGGEPGPPTLDPPKNHVSVWKARI